MLIATHPLCWAESTIHTLPQSGIYSPELVSLDGKIVETRFKEKNNDNHSNCKEYPKKDETKQTEIQAHIFKKSSIIVERFPCHTDITSHMRKPHIVADRAVTAWSLENGVFL